MSRQSLTAFLATQAIPHEPWYADNSRETVRDEILRPLRARFGAVRSSATLPPTSPAPSMTLDDAFARLFDPALSGFALEEAIDAWAAANLGVGEEMRRRALARLRDDGSEVAVTLPGRGRRLLPPGESSVLTAAVVEEFATRFLVRPYVLVVCHGGDPTASDDHAELASFGLSLEDSPALPDAIILDAGSGDVWFVEVVSTAGEIDDVRRAGLVDWVRRRGVDPGSCRFLTVFRSRSAPVTRRRVARVAWGTDIWFADEPDHLMRLE